MNTDKEIINFLNEEIQSKEGFLDFLGEDFSYATHSYHGYPATMIPLLPKLFIEAVTKFKKISSIYDPFAGSGTTLVESSLHGIDSVGVDLNPLATMMSRVKTNILDENELEKEKNNLFDDITYEKNQFEKGNKELNIPNFKNIDYWFKDYVINDLEIIKEQIQKISDDEFREFFLLCFSSTCRYVSNTRNSEFKMYRIPPEKMESWKPDVFGKFFEIVNRNVELNNKSKKMSGNTKVILGTSANTPSIPNNSFDMLITSPPYGDSKTTVAYGQFSRTSLQWLDLDEMKADQVPKLDSKLLGGKVKSKEIVKTQSKKLNEMLDNISKVDMKRALEVSQFYQDLYETLKEISRVMKPGSYQFWVTANRTVKGFQLGTDEIITELYSSLGIKKIAEFDRNIPNKRLPSKNSPTNKKGKLTSTMNKENIVMYKKNDEEE
ncbi:Modification methylase MvaI [Apilactobacillus kunkeei]|uniref:DNA methyltransferase n=1 Tax=Apilactobacillus kunkeei TaxID=148814 RepID=UPI0006C4775F|nr:DNA methyltransferase [Apilactobacillus kunkeei]KOY76036.1 Modification methylase MvaI [Apilactobacillus kunkeei]